MAVYTLREDAELILDNVQKEYILKIRDLPAEEKPREKLLKYGPDNLSLVELMAVLLNVGTKKEEVLAMSSRLLKEYGEKAIIGQKDPGKLSEALNIPIVKACQIVACFELGKRFFKTSNGKPVCVRTPRQVYDYLKDMGSLPKEHLRGLYLNSRYNVIHDEIISIGSPSANIIHPREVFRPALENSASALILAHNHPSGFVESSEADLEITGQLVEAGKILGINLLDHVIITKDKFASVPVNYD